MALYRGRLENDLKSKYVKTSMKRDELALAHENSLDGPPAWAPPRNATQ